MWVNENVVRTPLVALLGNPNTGKSTLFNRLTGLRQRIANYPGITVEKRTGTFFIGSEPVELLDLPGAYSLAAHSPDERVVVDALSGAIGDGRPDLLLCVLDATNLKRNLFLASQLAEFGIPMVLVLNQWDLASRNGAPVNPSKLEACLGVPVIAATASRGEGIDAVREAVAAQLNQPRLMRRIEWPDHVGRAADFVCDGAAAQGVLIGQTEALRLLFDNGGALRDRLGLSKEDFAPIVSRARDELRASGLNPGPAEALLHYVHIDALLEAAKATPPARARRASESVDALLLHRFWGTLAFLGVMWVVFQSVYSWAGPLMDGIDAATGMLQGWAGGLLEGMPVLQSLVVDGVIAGVGGVVIFLPQIFVLFLFIGLLEDTGYLARAAFLMDKLFGWCGLNGKSFVPLLSSYACAIPGVMAARALEDPRARLTTILVAPLMSCSARLPVYVLLIGAFIEPVYGAAVAGLVLFAMHFVGAAVAMPLAWLVNRVIFGAKPLPFILEMPDYKVPLVRNLALRMWERGREFLVRAGTVILAFSVIIWALLYFPHDPAVESAARQEFVARQQAASGASLPEIEARLADEDGELAAQLQARVNGAYIEHSWMGRAGRAVQPIFDPAGFDWKITLGVLSSFPAREVIISTLGIIYNLGSDVDEESGGLRATMAAERWTSGPRAGQPVYTIPVVVGIMVFFALCMQCGATVAVIARELNWRWAVASFVSMTALAWLAAVVVCQAGSRLTM